MKATLLFLVLGSAPLLSSAQPVYRCEQQGKGSYSDAPCLGGKRIDATPTQGMDKMTGTSRKSKEVRRDEFTQALDEALKPLSGLSHDEMNVLRKRQKLSTQARQRCALLDRRVPQLERSVATLAQGVDKTEAELALYQHRKETFELGC